MSIVLFCSFFGRFYSTEMTTSKEEEKKMCDLFMVFNNANNNKCFHKLISNDKKSADIHWNEIELLLNQLKSIFDEIESLKREQ